MRHDMLLLGVCHRFDSATPVLLLWVFAWPWPLVMALVGSRNLSAPSQGANSESRPMPGGAGAVRPGEDEADCTRPKIFYAL